MASWRLNIFEDSGQYCVGVVGFVLPLVIHTVEVVFSCVFCHVSRLGKSGSLNIRLIRHRGADHFRYGLQAETLTVYDATGNPDDRGILTLASWKPWKSMVRYFRVIHQDVCSWTRLFLEIKSVVDFSFTNECNKNKCFRRKAGENKRGAEKYHRTLATNHSPVEVGEFARSPEGLSENCLRLTLFGMCGETEVRSVSF